ncbi:MAG: hypothetical protein A2Z16_03955 [Chloroflexi bacterium RBG_16_54_18]|nr:MAG: hypothetical protein A2Z16_03955 [Chloroflexi bacterium RBG_16_54_18]
MPSTTLGIFSALLAALTWGGADYLGGFAARRLKAFQVLYLVALAGLAAMLVLTVAAGEDWLSPTGLFYSALAGICSGLGITALYRGLTMGNTAFVAPLSAVIGATTPVLFEFVSGNPPEITQLAGFTLALSGIWLVSRAEHEQAASRFSGWRQSLIAGLGFGAFFVLIAQVPDGSLFMPLVVVKSVTILLALAVAWIRRDSLPSPRHNPIALLAGFLDVAGNVFYLLASQWTRLDVAAVLSSMSPAVVVMLARIFTHEAITSWQWLGVAVCIASIVLITI